MTSRPNTAETQVSTFEEDAKVDEGDVKSDESKHDPFLVRFDLTDPARPRSWPFYKKIWVTALSAILVLNATFSSSAPTGIVPQLMAHYHFSEIVATLSISVFVAGYCVGPLLWGPLSEAYGRRPVFLVTFLFYVGFQVGSALAKNTASLIVFRFLGGTFAATPLTNSAAVVADVWDAGTRGKALAFFTLAPFTGPAIAPIVSGYIAVAGVNFRWVFWILAIFSGVCFLAILFTMDESYEPVLLVKKAQKLRKETGDERYYAPREREDAIPFKKRLENILIKPFVIFFREPMLIAITFYMSFVYGCLYLNFEGYPIVFVEGHHLNSGESGLMFLPIFFGGLLGVTVYLVYYNPRYEKLVIQYAPHPVPPEQRLNVAVPGSVLFTISFFWFGWTSYPQISYWAPMMAGLAFGVSIVWSFLALFNYIIDAYLSVAASALAISTVFRSLAGAGFPLFATQMYHALNPRWTSTLLGCVAILGIPIPFVLKRYGPVLRRKSKYAPAVDLKHLDSLPVMESSA